MAGLRFKLFSFSLQGLPKKSESFFVAMKGIWSVLKGHYGSVRMNFAQPFSLKVSLLNL